MKEAERMEIARQMLSEGIDEAVIKRACGLTGEQIAALKNSD